MLITAIAAGVALIGPFAYVILRHVSATRQEIEFAVPQDKVAAIHLDIQGDTVRNLRIFYADGTWSEVRELDPA